MNIPLRRVAVACLVLFLGLLVNINYIQAINAENLNDNDKNIRPFFQQFERERGEIRLSDGTVIARSVETKGQFRYKRVYSNGPLYAPITGYYSLYSATGIENTENDLLSGEDSRLLVRRWIDIATGKQAKGASVVLTVDRQAQQIAYDGLKATGKRGAVVALDPRTGAVLALASYPTYDPNDWTIFDGDKLDRLSKRLNGDRDKPLLNRAINENYPPGSTFKAVTTAAGFSSGDYDPDTEVDSPQRFTLPGTRTNLINFGGHACGNGKPPLRTAFQISCNTTFARIGLDLGADQLQAQAEAFGFNNPDLAIPLPVSTSVFPAGPDRAQTAMSAIGQFEVRATPLQVAMIAAAVANGGRLMKPYLVKEVRGQGASTISQTRPEELGEAVSPEVADQMREVMELVTRPGGTAYPAGAVSGISVAAKTGTAENVPDAPDHAVYTAFAPADNPVIAIGVVVEGGGLGGDAAAPIARRVIEAVVRP